MSKILDGKLVSNRIKEELKAEVVDMKEQGINSCLAVIIVGSDTASQVYVASKQKACEYIGIKSQIYSLLEDVHEEDLISLINSLNEDEKVNGILVQLPLPKHIDEQKVINTISHEKDVDAFHPINVGKIMIGDYDYLPCTPAGIMELIKESEIDLTGKHCVVVGRSNIVGKPMSMLLLHQNATVTICHSKTKNLKEICKSADVLVVAIGKANFIDKEYVKDGTIVIDVGINRLENKKLCGDVDFDSVKEVAGAITPVPGGVGPMTIAMLMKNTITAAKKQNKGCR